MAEEAFSTADNQRFWDGNVASYQMEENAAPIIFLTRSFIGRRVLDAGAGEGTLVRELRKLRVANASRGGGAGEGAIECIGVDISPKSSDVEAGDLTQLRFEDESFDTVYCSEVIEHCTPEDTAKILREISRVLAPGGHLILTTPYDERLEESLVTCPGCDRSFHRWGHQQRFVEEDFAALAIRSGLEPLSIFPAKYSRVRRLRFLGAKFFRGEWMASRVRRSGGHRKLLMIARKRV